MSLPHDQSSEYKSNKHAFTTQISSLRVAYYKLASRYRDFSLLLRRDVQLHHAFERFHCAALFQHLPAAFQAGGDGTEGGLNPEPDKALAADELCPVSRGWYARLVNASTALEAWSEDESGGSDASTIKSHILWAEISLYHAERLLDSIISQLPLTYQATSPAVMIKSWNRLCEGVKTDLADEAAMEAAMAISTSVPGFEMPKPPGTIFVRTWFTSEHVLPSSVPPASWLAQLRKTTMPLPRVPAPPPASQPEAGKAGPSGSGTAEAKTKSDQSAPSSGEMPPPGSGSASNPYFSSYGTNSGPPPPQNTPYENYFGQPPSFAQTDNSFTNASPFGQSSQGFQETYGRGRGGSSTANGQNASNSPRAGGSSRSSPPPFANPAIWPITTSTYGTSTASSPDDRASTITGEPLRHSDQASGEVQRPLGCTGAKLLPQHYSISLTNAQFDCPGRAQPSRTGTAVSDGMAGRGPHQDQCFQILGRRLPRGAADSGHEQDGGDQRHKLCRACEGTEKAVENERGFEMAP